jgi:hypothetical protein
LDYQARSRLDISRRDRRGEGHCRAPTRRRAPASAVRAARQRAIAAAAVWAQVRARPAAERQAVIRAHGQLAPQEVARLIALSAAAARLEVLDRLARRDDALR